MLISWCPFRPGPVSTHASFCVRDSGNETDGHCDNEPIELVGNILAAELWIVLCAKKFSNSILGWKPDFAQAYPYFQAKGRFSALRRDDALIQFIELNLAEPLCEVPRKTNGARGGIEH
jgi:hypothetical protein